MAMRRTATASKPTAAFRREALRWRIAEASSSIAI